jgi:hypothetical protein
MTIPASAPAVGQPDSTGSERQVLEAFLDFHRQALVSKVDGLSERQARQRRVPSKTTLAGLIRHMTGVERGWFQEVLAGRKPDDIGPNVGGGDDSWDLAEDETVGNTSRPASSHGKQPHDSRSMTPCPSPIWARSPCGGSTST